MKKDVRFELTNDPPNDWDKFVVNNYGYFFQSTKWADSYKKMGIGNGRYLRLYDGEVLVAQLLIIESLIGGVLLLDYIPNNLLKFLQLIPFLKTFTFHMSPVVDKSVSGEKLADYLSVTLAFLKGLADKEHKNIGPADFITFNEISQAKAFRRRLSKNLKSRIVATTRVEILDSEEAMLRVVQYSRRKNIARAQRLGLEILKTDIGKIKYYWKHLREAWRRHGLSVASLKYYQSLPKDNLSLFFANKDQKLLGGNGLLTFGSTCIEFSVFITELEKKDKTRAGDLIKWEIIKYCIKNKIKYWDLNMIEVEEDQEKTEKINFYKLEWNGKILYGVEIFYLNGLLKIAQKLKHKSLGK